MLYRTLVTYCNLFIKKTDKTDIRVFLESSPQYPNLLSVIQTLKYAGMDVDAGQCDWEYLRNLASPFLLHFQKGKKETLVIARWDQKHASMFIYNMKGKRWERKEREDIVHLWDGVVIYTDRMQMKRGGISTFTFATLIFVCLALSIAFCSIVLKIDITALVSVILGVVISGCLYLREEMPESGLIGRLCHISVVADCEAVERSSFSSMLGFKMNCLALSFFISQLMCLMIGSVLELTDIPYSLFSISAIAFIPLTAYSAFGQFRIRKLCPLCLGVILCLAMESGLFLLWHGHPVRWDIIAVFCGIYIVTLFILKHILESRIIAMEYLNEKISSLRIRRRKEVLLAESRPVNNTVSPIYFGDRSAKVRITTILSPQCGHCRKVVALLAGLMKKGLKFRWEIILGNVAKDNSVIVERWTESFLADKDIFFENLILCGDRASKQSIPISHDSAHEAETSRITDLFETQITELGISGFPVIILNDRLLSDVYSAGDLKFLIGDLSIINK